MLDHDSAQTAVAITPLVSEADISRGDHLINQKLTANSLLNLQSACSSTPVKMRKNVEKWLPEPD
ncbi:MAG: hypothetical protein JO002_10185 [Burkholderiaceae bacterium]|nr:hypothetical protein [Burkholderiaceae bacterium]